jgi:hypothetical protein
MFSKRCRIFWVLVLSLFLTNIPYVAAAEGARQMISTTNAVEILSRHDAEAKVQAHLSDSKVRMELEKHGVSADEASKRLASLSDAELSQLAKQMDQARYGGDPVTGILVLVVLVLLIIFLVKRV